MKKRSRPPLPALAGALALGLVCSLFTAAFLRLGGDDPEAVALAYVEAVAQGDAAAVRVLAAPDTGRADALHALEVDGGAPMEVTGVRSEQLGALCDVRVDGVRAGVEETWRIQVFAQAQRWPVRVFLGRDQRWYLEPPREPSAAPRGTGDGTAPAHCGD
ncbi:MULTISPECIES: hypothetical protein [unclassified Nocardiopsis]|uniref:hypothetical protein n=1 Tax=Nocardiopsis TaxID=2013 RepID=UPI00387B2ECD